MITKTKYIGTLKIASDSQENISFLEELIKLTVTPVSGNAILLLLSALFGALIKLIADPV